MTEIFFNGPSGKIEGLFHQSSVPMAPTVLILHPHPQHGGTMRNKVIYYMYRAFALNNFSVLRINFRGVGKSAGEFSKGVGELNDAAVAMDWLQNKNPSGLVYWVAGFSFGAWIAMQLLMRRPEVSTFLSVAPPVDLYDFSFLSPCPAAGLIVHGTEDSIVKEKNVASMAAMLNKQSSAVEYSAIKGAGHFFNDHIPDLVKVIDGYIKCRSSSGHGFESVKTDKKRRRIRVN